MTIAQELETLLPPGSTLRFGEIRLMRSPQGEFQARHSADADVAIEALSAIDSPAELREVAKFDTSGTYRPLKTAPTLKSGWITCCDEVSEFLRRIDAIYPAVFALWVRYRDGEHAPTSLRKTLDRQTGMYRFAGAISDQMANQIMRGICSPGCVRKIAWPINDTCPVSRLKDFPGTIPAICTEACTFVVSAARELAKAEYDRLNPPEVATAE
jgi:sirohydrochlorin cobaltochelatase